MTNITANPNRKIIIFDHLSPEDGAMAMSMYSRDPQSIQVHLDKIAQGGSSKFMGDYYVGFGHQSIGDSGSTNICAELVSMLDAKSIQDDPLYDGTEASTRYLDMNKTGVLNPLGTKHGEAIQRSWMSLYNLAINRLPAHLREKYPMTDKDNATDKTRQTYEKAIEKKAFDIARGFLPAGCLTYVGWHASLRKAYEHTRDMSYHPLAEIRQTAEEMLAALKEKYPASFGQKIQPEEDAYYRACAKMTYHLIMGKMDFWSTHTFDKFGLWQEPEVLNLLAMRPRKCELPKWFNRYGQIQFQFLLDFGSFRDIQRHRSCSQIMPLLTTAYGFHRWYLAQLPDDLRELARETIEQLALDIEKIEDPNVRQYYIAMGFQVACELTCGLPSAVYIAERRSQQDVHPTLRPIAQQMATALKNICPSMALHADMGIDEWSLIRARQDIVKKVSM